MALDALDPLNLRDLLGRLDGVPGAARVARRALLPLPVIDRPAAPDADVFPPLRSRPIVALQGKRIGVVGSAGGGASVALVGVARAFEEAGTEPAAISACSGSVLWGAMWAAGLSSDEMLDLALSWRPEDHLAIQWAGLPRFALSALRGFTGLSKGDALERLLDRRLWHMSARETRVALHTGVYNLDRGRLEYFGSRDTPELQLGELARIAVAPPLLAEAVRVEGELYVDGGAVDAFPAEPLVADGGFDHVFGLNVVLPPGLEGEDVTAWARGHSGVLELARRSRRRLGDKLTLIEPLPHEQLRGPAFYDLFIDRRRWPELMRAGYEAATEALAPFRRARRPRRARSGGAA